MDKVMVVVASHEAARIFELESATDLLVERDDLLNASARVHERDLSSDRGGTTSGPGGSRHGFEAPHSAKEEALSRFVRELAATLDSAHQQGRCTRLYLVADPHVLGALRPALHASTHAAVAGEVVKNLVQHSVAEIRQHLPARL